MQTKAAADDTEKNNKQKFQEEGNKAGDTSNHYDGTIVNRRQKHQQQGKETTKVTTPTSDVKTKQNTPGSKHQETVDSAKPKIARTDATMFMIKVN